MRNILLKLCGQYTPLQCLPIVLNGKHKRKEKGGIRPQYFSLFIHFMLRRAPITYHNQF